MRLPAAILILALGSAMLFSACGNKQQPSPAGEQPQAAGGETAQQPAAPAPPQAAGRTTARQQAALPATPSPAPAAEKAQPKPLVVPAGTVLRVRLGQAVGSKSSQTGDGFVASLAQPVSVGDKVVIPAGAAASGTVSDAKSAGRFKGGASLGLSLNSITIQGREYPIQTTTVTQTSTGKGKRTAGLVGGGAAGGAVIGGLAGGGKGAAIGALVGAGAGTAGAGLTGNREIELPAESALSFKLKSALTLNP